VALRFALRKRARKQESGSRRCPAKESRNPPSPSHGQITILTSITIQTLAVLPAMVSNTNVDWYAFEFSTALACGPQARARSTRSLTDC
jgi:hypothetical protein